jgi:hypothetical protein
MSTEANRRELSLIEAAFAGDTAAAHAFFDGEVRGDGRPSPCWTGAHGGNKIFKE